MTEVRVALPAHLRTLARTGSEVRLEVVRTPTIAAVLDELESCYPVLRGTIRDHGSTHRRAYIRLFAAGRDLSHESPESLLPAAVRNGAEPLRVVGAIAGG